MSVTTEIEATEQASPALELATALMRSTITAAKQARPNARWRDLTAETISVKAPYAREYRLLAGQAAYREHVQPVGTPSGTTGGYRDGYGMTLIGFRADITNAVAAIDRVREVAEAGLAAATPRDGEDTGTFRSSFLLAFALGMTGETLTRAQVEKRIAAPIVKTGDGIVRMRSTGSGSWAGYLAARAMDGRPALDETGQVSEAEAA